ncbi:unnamed protein product [Nesidiocoris tenuis]|uniref:Uncharacterized protein n=1 Tax=Nesidiocoris tenuis TaxID=355587 RepID=A0A6H5HH14_9HEMI|nr:unnamed protein product [Nesidiocoris tenuis]
MSLLIQRGSSLVPLYIQCTELSSERQDETSPRLPLRVVGPSKTASVTPSESLETKSSEFPPDGGRETAASPVTTRLERTMRDENVRNFDIHNFTSSGFVSIDSSLIILKYVKGPRAGPGPLGPRAPGILPPLPPPLDGPGQFQHE